MYGFRKVSPETSSEADRGIGHRDFGGWGDVLSIKGFLLYHYFRMGGPSKFRC